MRFQEVVEAEGHLIDSHIMENIFDKVVEYNGRFEVEQFRIGKTNSEPSYLRLKVETPDGDRLQRLLNALLELGCAPVDSGDAILRTVERDRCAPRTPLLRATPRCRNLLFLLRCPSSAGGIFFKLS